jgi:uncharacterized membrane protein YphA (DoxX/SURF4 family)
VIFIRSAVGLIFFALEILKYIDHHMGVFKFTKIGFQCHGLAAHFVSFFEIVCGMSVLIDLFTRQATFSLLIVIPTAIATPVSRTAEIVAWVKSPSRFTVTPSLPQ